MAIRARLLFIGLGLAVLTYGGMLAWHHHQRFQKLAVVDDRCTADGKVITGNDFDDFGQLCIYAAENRAIQASGTWPEVVAFGDSLTRDWPFPDTSIVNRGIAGQTTSQMLLRFRQDVIDNHPSIVHLLAGTNDITGLTGPVSLPQIRGSLLDMIELARAHDAIVILGTIPPMGSYNGERPGEPAKDVARINAVIRDIAKDQRLILADYYAATSDGTGGLHPALFIEDKVHLTPAGYKVMQTTFNEALASARLAKSRSAPRPDR